MSDQLTMISKQLYVRKYACLRNEHPDGVCGCPEFWGMNRSRPSGAKPNSQAQAQAQAQFIGEHQQIGTVKEICFFWYHGKCRRGNRCPRAHEFHVTWPIFSPPDFVHRQPCDLPYCPLKKIQSLYEVLTKRDEQQEQNIDGQIDGDLMSLLGGSDESSQGSTLEEGEVAGHSSATPNGKKKRDG